jgi:hypothetical protein
MLKSKLSHSAVFQGNQVNGFSLRQRHWANLHYITKVEPADMDFMMNFVRVVSLNRNEYAFIMRSHESPLPPPTVISCVLALHAVALGCVAKRTENNLLRTPIYFHSDPKTFPSLFVH